MTIPPGKWRSQMRLEIPPALWESHLRSEDRRCVLKSHLRYENRTCEVEIADAFWNPAAALWESHLRSDGRRCILKTHLRPSLRRCDSHNAAAERSGTLTSAENMGDAIPNVRYDTATYSVAFTIDSLAAEFGALVTHQWASNEHHWWLLKGTIWGLTHGACANTAIQH